MSQRKREHGQLLWLRQIHNGGSFLDMGDKVYFMFKESPLHRIRVFGVVINRYDSPENDRQYTYLVIDDGTDTIRLKLWSRSFQQDDGTIYNPISMFNGIQEGDIVDVLGKVREYEDEFFIIPDSINSGLNLDWEIHRRIMLNEMDIEEKGLQDLANSPFFVDGNDDLNRNLNRLILKSFSMISDENTVASLAYRLQKSETEIQETLHNLHKEGLIIEIREGIYSKLEDI